MLPQKRVRKPWMPWVKLGLVGGLVFAAGWGAMEVGQRYLGLQKLVIEQINISGCQGDRHSEIQRIADQVALARPPDGGIAGH